MDLKEGDQDVQVLEESAERRLYLDTLVTIVMMSGDLQLAK